MTEQIKVSNAGIFGSKTVGKMSPELVTSVLEKLKTAATKKTKGSTATSTIEDLPLKAVLYTDGGCKPSRGIGGWGVHGYTYTTAEPKQGPGCPNVITNLGYVDDKNTFEEIKSAEGMGSHFPRTQMLVEKIQVVTPIQYIDGFGSLIPISTNNIAELTATTNALRYAIAHGVTDLLLMTDSSYVIKGVGFCDNWEKQGWKRRDGMPVANIDEWITLITLYRELLATGCNVSLEWVQGHSGDFGNDTADSYASRSIIAGKKGLQVDEYRVTDAKGYWSKKIVYNRFLTHPYWYFNTHVGGSLKSPDNRTIYFVGDHGTEDEFVGKKVSDAGFAVLYLKEPEPIMEQLTAYQDSLDKSEFSNVIVGRLSNIMNASNYLDIQNNGTNFLHQPNYGRNDVCTSNDVLITRELRPPLTAFRLADNLSTLEEVLRNYLEMENSILLTKTEVTSLFYEEDKAAKKPVTKLLPTITSAIKKMDVQVNYDTGVKSGVFKIPITFGLDMGIRNLLAGIAEFEPKVEVVTWRESDQSFRYATVVQTSDDIGIWASIYSNICLLPS